LLGTFGALNGLQARDLEVIALLCELLFACTAFRDGRRHRRRHS
jgi:hypothetical protein